MKRFPKIEASPRRMEELLVPLSFLSMQGYTEIVVLSVLSAILYSPLFNSIDLGIADFSPEIRIWGL